MKPTAARTVTAPAARANARPGAKPAAPSATAPPPAAGKRADKVRTIGATAAEVGVHVETIRYYERIGLIPQPPRGRSYRHYPAETVRALRFIRQAREFGFTLKEIAVLLALERDNAGCAEMCERVDRKLAEVERQIAALTALRNELARMVKHSPRRGRHTECKVFDCLSGGSSC